MSVSEKKMKVDGDVVGLDDEVTDEGEQVVTITLEGEEDEKDKKYTTDKRYAGAQSVLCRTVFYVQDTESKDLPIPAGRFPPRSLEMAVAYMNQNETKVSEIIPKPLQSTNMAGVTNEADAKFIDKFYSTDGIYALYDLTAAANYLDMKSLLSLICAKIASLVKGKSRADITSILDPENRAKNEGPQRKRQKT